MFVRDGYHAGKGLQICVFVPRTIEPDSPGRSTVQASLNHSAYAQFNSLEYQLFKASLPPILKPYSSSGNKRITHKRKGRGRDQI